MANTQTTVECQCKKLIPLTDEFGITDMIDVGHYSLQLMFKSREDADKFKAAHGIKGDA